MNNVTTWEKETDTNIFFWNGPLSNWWWSPFDDTIVEKQLHFESVEQFMMATKAYIFADFDIFDKIMKENDPKYQKALGRSVRNFDDVVWKKYARRLVYRGIYSKFNQNPELKALLLSTGDKILVEASPYDHVWGIGVHFDKVTLNNWQGQNWLGQILMRVRKDLREGVDMRGKIFNDDEYFGTEPQGL